MKKDTRIRKQCSECGGWHTTEGEIIRHCDQCSNVIDEKVMMEPITIFYLNGEDAKTVDVCSWECFSRFIQKFKFDDTVHFMDFPFIEKGNFSGFIDILKYELFES